MTIETKEVTEKDKEKVISEIKEYHKQDLYDNFDLHDIADNTSKEEEINDYLYTKNYEYDDIFWKVLQMPSNSKQADSLRAVGAFKAPSILIEKGEVELTENYEELAESLVELIMECSHDFMKNYDIDEYVVNNAEGMNFDILKYLAYIHMNRVNEAQVIAEEAIKSGKVGSFKNGGKSFFEWAIMAE